ncbi:hypothetical protein ERJ75_001035400 [Trypanosoma vivax]|nr:hypothetical protein ERJ75_001035400 [Trypanosoma vivax]
MRNFRHRLENTEECARLKPQSKGQRGCAKERSGSLAGTGSERTRTAARVREVLRMKHLRTENEGPKIQLARDTGRDLRRRITASWNALAEVGWGDRQDRKTEKGHTRKRMECLARVAALVADAGRHASGNATRKSRRDAGTERTRADTSGTASKGERHRWAALA